MTTAGKCWSSPTWRTAEKGGLDKGWLHDVIFLLKTINLFSGSMMVSLRIGGDQQKNITGYFEFAYKIICTVQYLAMWYYLWYGLEIKIPQALKKRFMCKLFVNFNAILRNNIDFGIFTSFVFCKSLLVTLFIFVFLLLENILHHCY